jgi:hypothetical protein
MSGGYKFYAQKMADRRDARERSPLRRQLVDLMRVVVRGEAMWALEDRAERSANMTKAGWRCAIVHQIDGPPISTFIWL